MVEIARAHGDVLDLERPFDQLVIADPGVELIERHRKVGILHLPGQRILQGRAYTLGPVDIPLGLRNEKRGEKRDALYVVPVRMADEHVPSRRGHLRGHQGLSQAVQSGPAIEDDQGAGRGPHLHARGISAVAQRAGAGFGQRASGTPEAHAHGGVPCLTLACGSLADPNGLALAKLKGARASFIPARKPSSRRIRSCGRPGCVSRARPASPAESPRPPARATTASTSAAEPCAQRRQVPGRCSPAAGSTREFGGAHRHTPWRHRRPARRCGWHRKRC